ncbi:MAG: hypothetical protein LBE08_03730 [Bifidobacteriaceae bacterium]|nr:hypothetical protein [Bifidobacteriaceae bacterium]
MPGLRALLALLAAPALRALLALVAVPALRTLLALLAVPALLALLAVPALRTLLRLLAVLALLALLALVAVLALLALLALLAVPALRTLLALLARAGRVRFVGDGAGCGAPGPTKVLPERGNGMARLVCAAETRSAGGRGGPRGCTRDRSGGLPPQSELGGDRRTGRAWS